MAKINGPLPGRPAPLLETLAFLSTDRTAERSLTEQIVEAISSAILDGRLQSEARLPSWRDLAVQLGVSRGTVQTAYARLSDQQLIVASGAAGTRVARVRADSRKPGQPAPQIEPPLQALLPGFSIQPLPFQMGVPAQDAFPVKLWTRLRRLTLQEEATASVSYPDPRGEPSLRAQIAAYLALAQGIRCVPDQIIVTSGYRAGLNLAIRGLKLEGQSVWMEDPGYPVGRMALELAAVRPVPVPIDAQGLDVRQAQSLAPHAAAALLTPGQQAPLGYSLSARRRQALLSWAYRNSAWVLEDDYLSELQLEGRLQPALAAEDPRGRTIHLGTFSKTLSPALGLGFVVVPLAQATHFGAVAACLSPAPSPSLQNTVARLLCEGHYLRHIRHMKRLYLARRHALLARIGHWRVRRTMAGLSLLVELARDRDDQAIAAEALRLGLAPSPLSPWYQQPEHRRQGLLLGVTNLSASQLDTAVRTLSTLIAGEPP